MLTIIVSGNDRDFLTRAIREVGHPDRVFVIDEETKTYTLISYFGTKDEETVEALPMRVAFGAARIFNGDAAVVKGIDGTLLDDFFSCLPNATDENLPPWAKGARYRLIQIYGDSPGHVILDEKSVPPIEEFIPGNKLPPLGS